MTEASLETKTQQNNKPEFDGGSFEITYLSTSPEGFQFETDKAIPKVETISLNALEKEALKRAMQREQGFNGVNAVREARDAWRLDVDDAELEAAFYEARETYQEKGKKIGIRNIRVEDNIVHADVQIVQFPVYNLYAHAGQGPEKERLSRVAATAMIVRTADQRIIVQHRAIETQHLGEGKKSRGNANFTDVPGASVAGLMDASLKTKDRRPGFPDPISTNTVRNSILKEAGEELGLGEEDFTSMRAVGIAVDHVKVHDEILMLADTDLTAADLREVSRLSNRNKNLGDADFEEKFIDIEATPQAIGTLLTEVRCPIPPTHAAVLVAAGYSIALQTHGLEFANNWRDAVEEGVRSNYQQMDEIVTEYYQRFPEVLEQVPERFWGKNVPKRNPNGYMPAYGPTEQGLPSFEDEMVRTGLMQETREVVQAAHLFDIKETSDLDDDLLTEIAQKLDAGEPVGFNGIKSVADLEQHVILPLGERLQDRSKLERLAVIGENGSSWLSFDAEGQPLQGQVSGVIPENLTSDTNKLIIGTDRFLQHVADLGLKPKAFEVFGNSPATAEMAKELVRKGHQLSQ